MLNQAQVGLLAGLCDFNNDYFCIKLQRSLGCLAHCLKLLLSRLCAAQLQKVRVGRALVLRLTQGVRRRPRGGSANMRRCTAALPLL